MEQPPGIPLDQCSNYPASLSQTLKPPTRIDGHRVKARRLKDGWMVKDGPTFNATLLFDR